MKRASHSYLDIRPLLSSLILGGVCVADQPAEVPASNETPVNDPASALEEVYEAKARFEHEMDERILQGRLRFFDTAAEAAAKERPSRLADSLGKQGGVPASPWWTQAASRSLLANAGRAEAMSLEELYHRALVHSSQVKVFASIPLIRETAIDEAKGEFDPEIYASTRYDRTDEPTGSLLETGDPDDFFRENAWTIEGGVRKKFLPGTEVSLGQELTEVANNSEFFVPGDQGEARLKLTVRQPLLRGGGVRYNRTLMQIARLDAETGYDEFIRQLETHLMEVNRSYWALYLARVNYLEKQRLVSETQRVVGELESRGNLDAMASQQTRAKAALVRRRTELVRAELAIKNAQSRLRSLVSDPYFAEAKIGEIIPSDRPIAGRLATAFESSIAQALELRPEIKQAENHLRASRLRERMARNEKLPALDLFGEIGISALRDRGDIGGAYDDQFDDEAPSWSAGVLFSVPWPHRAAKARHLRTRLEVRQKTDQLRAAMETVLLEVEIAHREVKTAWPDVKGKWEAAVAAEEELEVLRRRRGVDADAGDMETSQYLELLLDAQERRTRARADFLEAVVIYNAALANLDRAKGTLLQHEQVGVERTEDEEELPLIELTKEAVVKSAKNIYTDSE